MPASAEAQAASVVKFGPRRLNRAATRPAMMFDSSPGIVSSVMVGRPETNRSRASARIAAWTSAGRAANDGDAASSRSNSG